MGYKVEKLRLGKFFSYISNVYHFQETIYSQKDLRNYCDVEIENIFMGVFLCLILRWGSFLRLWREVNRGQIWKFMPKEPKIFCANTIGYGLEKIEKENLETHLTIVPKKLKKNKAYNDTIGGLHIVALDGVEYFRSESIHCSECLEYHIKTKEGKITNYVHRAVIAQKVGTEVKSILAAEEIKKKDTKQKDDQTSGHEGELTSAKRLLRKLISLYGKRFFDVLSLDALYMNYPFFFLAESEGKYIVARVKDESSQLYKEIDNLSTISKPIKGYDIEENLFYLIYQIPDIDKSIGWDIPLTGYKIIERKKIIKNKKIIGYEENTFFCATNLPKWKAKANVVRKIVHAKWGIENNGIKDLKDNWYMTHNFHHHPIATFALLLIMFMAYNLFYAYVKRAMKTYRLYNLTQKEVQEEFIFSYISKKLKFKFYPRGP